MKSILDKVNEIDNLIHRMTKMEGMMWAGKWLDVHRECCSLTAALKRAKRDLLSSVEGNVEPDSEK